MIISFSQGFVFIRTRKTASTSTEIALSAWCAGRDIVVPIGVDDEIIRREYGGQPRNFCINPETEAKYLEAWNLGDRSQMTERYRDVMHDLRVEHHAPASVAKELVSPVFWICALKFAVERHPYEKVVSLAYWRARNRNFDRHEMASYLEGIVEQGEYRNWDLYADGQGLLVDKVFLYEELWPSLERLAVRFKTSLPKQQPRAKASFRSDRRKATDILSVGQKRRIYDRCGEEFEFFGFSRH